MGMFKWFIKNCWLSLVAYFQMSALGALCVLLYMSTVYNPGSNVARDPPLWLEIVLWTHSLVSAAFYFWFGTRVNLTSNYLLNFLSVSGSLAYRLLLVVLVIYFNHYLIMFGMFSFFMLTMTLADVLSNDVVTIIIVSIIPTSMIWLGMLYKARN